MDKILQAFNDSLQTGYVDKIVLSEVIYQPELLVNQKTPPKKVLSTIIQELENCNEFFISVAFVTTSGVATIINTLKELENSKVKGKILVSQYLNFTQPEALRKLSKFKNIDIQDQDFNSAFTIKTYSSEKTISDEGWQHTSIVLRPNSFDDNYENIIINSENGTEMRVVGEFIKVLKD